MKCSYYLQDVQNLLANGKSQIRTKIWWIIQRTFFSIWRTGSISHKNSEKNEARFHQFGKRGTLLVMHHSRRNLGKRYSDHWHWRIRKEVIDEVRNKYIKIYFKKTECERSLDNPKRWWICISCSRWFSKIIREKLRIPRTHSGTGIHREERENLSGELQGESGEREGFQLEEAKDDEGINKDFWAHAEARKEFHLSSSCWTEKFHCTCREKNHILFTKLYWCHQVNFCRSGDCTRKANVWLCGCRREQKSVRFVDKFYKIYVIERNSSKRIPAIRWSGGGVGDWRELQRHHVQIIHGLTHWQELGKQLKEERDKNE